MPLEYIELFEGASEGFICGLDNQIEVECGQKKMLGLQE